ncbi:hypothetical protein LSH36_988g00068 [Paralvinella palmiformis]|uniref:Phosphatidylinositol glycan anchor biosynthesis class U protein n=1 Tax=Paralvinella palmiformis TaxID=53620 RepID=A0AAD9IX19_9ANNE|nr:hypothetical protein LSH36_988g00068 [Paralvinella palmiformis]
MGFPLLITIVVGISIRVWLFRSPVLDWVTSRNEISSPLTSWKRVTEGLTLQKMGISPYTGDIFHEMPLMLRLYRSIDNFFGPAVNICFVILDVIIAILLERIASHFGKYMASTCLWLTKQNREVRDYSPDASKLILRTNQLGLSKLYVVAVYMLNPYVVAACVGKSTAVFTNLAIVLAILYTLKGRQLASAMFIACATYMSLYSCMLIIPGAFFFAQKDRKVLTHIQLIQSVIHHLLVVLVCLVALLYLSFMVEGSWKFLNSTYMFVSDPIFYMYLLLIFMAIFKSYPTYADTALYLSLLPLWKHVFPYMRNNFLVSCMLVACTLLGPVLWYLWIYAGSANANFYFAITLAYSSAQIFLVTDLLYGYLRRDYDLLHGPGDLMADGKSPKVILE